MAQCRIVFVAPSAYRLGGLASWLDYLLPGLARCGWDPILLLPDSAVHDASAYLKEHPWCSVIRLRNPSGSRWGRRRALMSAIDSVQPEMVISVNIPDALEALSELRLAGSSVAKAVMTVHGIQADLCFDAARYSSWLDGVVCTNRLACALVVELGGVSPGRVHYAPAGTQVPALCERPQQSHTTVLWAGRVDEREKRVSDALRIAERLAGASKISFLLVGDGPDRANAADYVVRHPRLKAFVRFTGAVAVRDMPAVAYQPADVLLITSGSETGPLVLWEAWAHGLAVVTSSYLGFGLEDALRHEENCLMFPVGDVDAAAHCIQRLAHDAELRLRLAAAGRALVAQRYSNESSVAAWDAALQAVLAAQPRLVEQVPSVPPAGRLDRWLGVKAADIVRRMTGKSFHHDTSSEWPHTYSAEADSTAFIALATRLDQPVNRGEK